jgi:hypothetical protein
VKSTVKGVSELNTENIRSQGRGTKQRMGKIKKHEDFYNFYSTPYTIL